MTNVEKLAQIAKPRSEASIERARERRENREWRRMSQDIALCLHYYLRKSDMTQKVFAEKMQVSPAQVCKLLKGEENLTLETVCKIQNVIGKEFVTISKPYLNKVTVEVQCSTRFSNNAARSESYNTMKIISNNDFLPTTEKVA